MKLSHRNIPLILLMFVTLSMKGHSVDHWETILQPGSTCTFLVPDGSLPANWSDIGFNDASWNSGTGGVGYGDGDDNSVIPNPTVSVYSRYKFTASSPDAIGALILEMDFDDGFVAYLNGVEVARDNMGSAGIETTWDQLANAQHEATMYNGGVPSRFNLYDAYVGNLVAGENVFALEVHNFDTTSSDLSSNAFLFAGINDTQSYYSPLPEWFVEPVFSGTLLPLMVIDTRGETIPDDPRIVAHMGLIHNSDGALNKPYYPFNEYDGQISIEIRGESTQMYDKKSYSIETQTDIGTNNNVSLLGLPVENDWILNGPYGDKSLLRNVLSYKLYMEFGNYAPRTRFFELLINGEYMGIYVLLEKIKVDKNRVNIANITPLDVTPDDISGGYILRIDKTTGMAPPLYWDSPVSPPYLGFSNIRYQYFDPDYEDLTAQQSQYIRDYMAEFDQMLSSINFDDLSIGYRNYIDVRSFIDMMILNEFTKDVDAYRLSNYFYKQKDSNGGKIVAGPPWDYNLTFGNNDFAGDAKETYNWMYPKTINPYWWKRLLDDPWFENQANCRWEELHAGPLSLENVHLMIDSSVQLLGSAIDRNFEKWQILGEYVWPNSFVGETYAQEIEYLKNWSSERLTWINSEWGDQCIPTADNLAVLEPKPDIYVYPNPGDFATAKVTLNLNKPEQSLHILIMDINGRVVDQLKINNSQMEGYQISLPDYSYLSAGLYVIQVRGESGFLVNLKYLKR